MISKYDAFYMARSFNVVFSYLKLIYNFLTQNAALQQFHSCKKNSFTFLAVITAIVIFTMGILTHVLICLLAMALDTLWCWISRKTRPVPILLNQVQICYFTEYRFYDNALRVCLII